VQIERIKERVEKRFREELVHGKKKEGFIPDPAGFVVVHVDHKMGRVIVEHYNYKRQVKYKIVGDDAESLCDTLLGRKLITRLDHAAYVGRELAKAEAGLRHGMRYTQDKSL